MTPDPRLLFRGDPVHPPLAAPSTWAGWAARALTRIHSKAPGVLEVLAPASGQTPRSLQHALSLLTDDADSLSLIAALKRVDDAKMPWRQARYYSNCDNSYLPNTVPSDTFTTFENEDFEIAIKRRLLLPIYHFNSGETFMCPRCKETSNSGCIRFSSEPNVDLYGNHAVRCPSASGGPRTEFWHDPLVLMWERIARFAGYKVDHEAKNLVISAPGLRADFFIPEIKTIVDLRTAVTCDKQLCAKAATSPGAAAEAGIADKENKWKAHVDAQGDIFLAIVHEDGGRLSDTAKDLLFRLARHFGNSSAEQAVFMAYALQRLHSIAQKGVAQLCRALRPIPTGAAHIPSPVQRFGAPMRRPAGSALARMFLPLTLQPLWQVAVLSKFSTRLVATAQPLVATPAVTSPVLAFAAALPQNTAA